MSAADRSKAPARSHAGARARQTARCDAGGNGRALAPPAYRIDFVDRAPGPAVIQAKWGPLHDPTVMLLSTERLAIKDLAQRDLPQAYRKMLKGLSTRYRHYDVDQSSWTPGMKQSVHWALEPTWGANRTYSVGELYEIIVETRDQHRHDLRAQVDSTDHGADLDAPEALLDWSELNQNAIGILRNVADPATGNSVLYNVFYELAQHHAQKASQPLQGNLANPYQQWLLGGVYTRAQFKQLIGLPVNSADDTSQIIQRARTGNSYTLNGGYDAAARTFRYDNVIYYRDGGGNIDFAQDPQTIRAAYNAAESGNVQPAAINWTNPVRAGSELQMSILGDKETGVMPSGKKVELKKASRPQHFAIADYLYPQHNRQGTWTWHHLTARYKMLLVDMNVHAKHGHNGGVHLWT